MSVVVLLLDDTTVSQVWIDNENTLNCLLEKLNEMLMDKRQNVYIRRNVRVYGKDAIYIVKPKQKSTGTTPRRVGMRMKFLRT